MSAKLLDGLVVVGAGTPDVGAALSEVEDGKRGIPVAAGRGSPVRTDVRGGTMALVLTAGAAEATGSGMDAVPGLIRSATGRVEKDEARERDGADGPAAVESRRGLAIDADAGAGLEAVACTAVTRAELIGARSADVEPAAVDSADDETEVRTRPLGRADGASPGASVVAGPGSLSPPVA